MPSSISPNPLNLDSDIPFCLGSAFEELQHSRGRKATDSLFDMCFGHDIPLAKKTRDNLQEIDCQEDVFTIIAHDSAVRDGVDHFPESLNEWKAKGWAKEGQWRFLGDFDAGTEKA